MKNIYTKSRVKSKVRAYIPYPKGIGVLRPIYKLFHYVVLLKDKPLASATLFVEEGIAGLYNVCTVSEFRNKGIGSFLSRYALKCAREMGISTLVLQSSVMGSNMYKKIGFEEFGRQSIFIDL